VCVCVCGQVNGRAVTGMDHQSVVNLLKDAVRPLALSTTAARVCVCVQVSGGGVGEVRLCACVCVCVCVVR